MSNKTLIKILIALLLLSMTPLGLFFLVFSFGNGIGNDFGNQAPKEVEVKPLMATDCQNRIYAEAIRIFNTNPKFSEDIRTGPDFYDCSGYVAMVLYNAYPGNGTYMNWAGAPSGPPNTTKLVAQPEVYGLISVMGQPYQLGDIVVISTGGPDEAHPDYTKPDHAVLYIDESHYMDATRWDHAANPKDRHLEGGVFIEIHSILTDYPHVVAHLRSANCANKIGEPQAPVSKPKFQQ